MIAYVLVLMVSLSTGQTTQALLEGPMSRGWCEQLIRMDRYNGEDGSIRRSPQCLNGQEAQQLLAASGCTRAPGPSPRWPSIQFDCRTPAAAVTEEPASSIEPPEASVEEPEPEPAPAEPPPPPEDLAAPLVPERRVRADAPSDTASHVTVPVAPSAALPEPLAPVRKQFRLGNAATALVAQAQQQASTGHYIPAAATIERALRIEPDNPLLWIELGRLRMAEGNAAQAESLYRKAVALASGDPEIEAQAWGLIAESLRARGRNQEAAEAESRMPSSSVD